ncbi:hypothetical protein EVAR_87178_1 [Eumeta japonica]|uniref:Uncharacterized protein n=1 Tax=Eumeta variegata TaxID=151549 RepID=A0A4C1VXR5_EUMVA|nr:hypothetical protein EVAR_87178_1 [Eumeta japonica]
MYRRPRARPSSGAYFECDGVMIRGCDTSNHLPFLLSSRAEMHAITSTALWKRRSPCILRTSGCSLRRVREALPYRRSRRAPHLVRHRARCRTTRSMRLHHPPG